MCRQGDYKSQNVIGFAGAFFTHISPPPPASAAIKMIQNHAQCPSHDAKILVITRFIPKMIHAVSICQHFGGITNLSLLHHRAKAVESIGRRKTRARAQPIKARSYFKRSLIICLPGRFAFQATPPSPSPFCRGRSNKKVVRAAEI